MDIKTRIDNLTEAEAKAALKYVLECYADEKAEPFFDATQEARIEFYQKVILDEALKEGARK